MHRYRILFAIAVIAVASMYAINVHAAGDTLATGTAAPNFSLPSQDGSPVHLTDYKGKWVVLYFYPKDQTTGCTIEAHNFQRDNAKYDALNAVVLGVSLDTVESHKTWCTKDGMTFKMLADPEHKVVDLYGVALATRGTNSYAKRTTFLIDPSGKITHVWAVTAVDGHSDEVLAEIAAEKK
jgi:peroxiredoxin Q/BCP